MEELDSQQLRRASAPPRMIIREPRSLPQLFHRLRLSPATAKTHIVGAMSDVGARERARLVVLAYQTGLVTPPRT